MIKLRQILFLICLFQGTLLFSQENIGILPDNYQPTLGMSVNPASIADQKPWLSFRLAGFGAYGRNNLAYLPDSRLLDGTNINDPVFNLDASEYRAYSSVDALGPALSLVLGKQSVGLHTNVKVFGLAENFSGELGNLIADDGFVADGNYRAKNSRVKTLAWGEVGLTYARIISQQSRRQISLGITVNRLFGIQNTTGIVYEADVDVLNNTGTLNNLSGIYSFAEPSFNAGRGWSTNLGFELKKMREDIKNYTPHSPNSGCRTPEYIYKLGISIVDMGSVNFSRASYSGTFDENTSVEGLEDILIGESTDVAALQQNSSFKASLPAAISIQYDHNLRPNLYLSGFLFQKLTTPTLVGGERANLLGAGFRYEHRWFALSIPVTMQDYIHPQLGLAVRLGPISIGSDHVIPIFFRRDIYAADIYANVEIPLMRSPKCTSKKSSGKKKKKGSRNDKFVPCPSW